MTTQMETELGRADLATPCRKVLESLRAHWEGLRRFVDDPRIPMDNNTSERLERGPAVARKNFYNPPLQEGAMRKRILPSPPRRSTAAPPSSSRTI